MAENRNAEFNHLLRKSRDAQLKDAAAVDRAGCEGVAVTAKKPGVHATLTAAERAAKRRAILDLVRPHYKAALKDVAFYRDWPDAHWDSYIGSRWVEAMEVAERLRDGLPAWPREGEQ